MATLGLIFCALLLLFTSSVPQTIKTVSGAGTNGAESASAGKYCVANPTADEKVLLGRIQYYCSSPLIDCKVIQPGEACFEPNNTFFHASVVFNIYYKFSHCAEDQCHHEDGSGMVITTDPSTPECHFV